VSGKARPPPLGKRDFSDRFISVMFMLIWLNLAKKSFSPKIKNKRSEIQPPNYSFGEKKFRLNLLFGLINLPHEITETPSSR